MNGKDDIQKLFSEKIGNMEANVNPALWNNIASQIGVAGTTAVAGSSLLMKLIIGSTVAASISVGAYLVLREDQKAINVTTTPQQKTTSVVGNEVLPISPIDDEKKTSEPKIELNNRTETTNPVDVIHPSTKNELGFTPLYPKEKKRVEENKGSNVIVNEENKEVRTNEKETTNEEAIAFEELDITLFTANVFTPNGDNTNDTLFVHSENHGLQNSSFESFSAVIFNAKGEIVKSFDTYDFEWTGEDNANRLAPDGMYSCMIIAKTIDNKYVKEFKSFELCRGLCDGR